MINVFKKVIKSLKRSKNTNKIKFMTFRTDVISKIEYWEKDQEEKIKTSFNRELYYSYLKARK